MPATFVQDNLSYSVRGVVRALHYQLRFPQGKLIAPLTGEIWDVVVDVRRGSPSFGKWLAVSLTADPCRQLYVPPGFAHGFAVVSEAAAVLYKCTDFYHPEDECSIIWNDPDLAIPWPAARPLLSPRDEAHQTLRARYGRGPAGPGVVIE
jgi:dTDP-4-dehydrorhamnose 3,5-epimerase